MSTAAPRSHRLWDPVALAAAVGVLAGGATVFGVVTAQHGAEHPSSPAVPSVPGRTALIIPIPVAPMASPTTQVAPAP
jgi:hypothetical protein